MRVLSWNVHGFVGAGGAFDPARTAATVRRIAPSVAAFQEIDLRVHGAAILEPLAEAIGPFRAEATAMGDGENWYGQLLVSRYPMARVLVHDITRERFEPRRILDVTLETEYGSLRVLATHFGLTLRERRYQQGEVRRLAAAEQSLPTLVIGDFNEWRPLWGAAGRLLGPGAKISPQSLRSFPAAFPLFALDRAATLPGALLKHTSLGREDAGASDHLPLVVELEPGVLGKQLSS